MFNGILMPFSVMLHLIWITIDSVWQSSSKIWIIRNLFIKEIRLIVCAQRVAAVILIIIIRLWLWSPKCVRLMQSAHVHTIPQKFQFRSKELLNILSTNLSFLVRTIELQIVVALGIWHFHTNVTGVRPSHQYIHKWNFRTKMVFSVARSSVLSVIRT